MPEPGKTRKLLMQKLTTPIQILALISLSAFSGALLFIALVVVRFWLSAEPEVFLVWMAEHFFRFPQLMVPLNLIALLTTVAALATVWNVLPAHRLPWGLGLLCLIVCTITFPIYFASANTEFVAGSIELSEVAPHLKAWASWNWTRTALALLAVGFASWGLAQPESFNQSA
jgi:hypothetical protein